MNTSVYVKPSDIIFMASAMVGDRERKIMPKGFYFSLIQEAIEGLALDTFFQELRHDDVFPNDTLTISLPPGCFNLKNVYIFTSDKCTIETSKKVWWKNNYYTKGSGFIANDKGAFNENDPFYAGHSFRQRSNAMIREQGTVNNRLFYNIQMGNIMFSASCRGEGNKIHFHYNGTGAGMAIEDEPIIPVFLRRAVEDYTIEAACRFLMANDKTNFKLYQALQGQYSERLNDPYEGSWAKAELAVKSMNSSQRDELAEYLSRGGWGLGR
jgi:hypothetical protein